MRISISEFFTFASGERYSGGYQRGLTNVSPTFSAVLNFQHVTKSGETLTSTDQLIPMLRRAFTLAKNGQKLEVVAEDNGGGFPFGGSFTLEEMELMRMGPVSIKRRVRMLSGEMTLDSRPGQGSTLEIRVPL